VTQPATPPVDPQTVQSVAERVEALCALIIGGATKKEAAAKIFGGNWGLWKATKDYPHLAANIAQAMAIQAHALADEAKEIADTDPDPNRARNRINVRQWLAARRNPKEYGDKMEVTSNHSISVLTVLTEARGRLLHGSTVQDAELVAPSDLPVLKDSSSEGIDIFS